MFDSPLESLPTLVVSLVWLLPLVLIDTGIGLLFVSLALRGTWPDQTVRVLTFLFGVVFVTSSSAVIIWGIYLFWIQNLSSLAIVNLFRL